MKLVALIATAQMVFGHPSKITPLPPDVPPSPPGMVVNVFSDKPLPGGRSYVSPKQFVKEMKDLVKAQVKFERNLKRRKK